MTIYDLIGIGFGPSNLALAVAIEEESAKNPRSPLKVKFLEKKQKFQWHPGMLLENTDVQISFMKDLILMKNPQSPFTFINYLYQNGRLNDFINLRQFFPSRIEFNDYFGWVARQLTPYVSYGKEVVSIQPTVEGSGGTCEVKFIKIVVKDILSGESEEYHARNLVVATGGTPHVPKSITLEKNSNVFHSNDFLNKFHREFSDRSKSYHFVVVGSGQSAAEIFYSLSKAYPQSQIQCALRQFSFNAADDSEFINEIFHPQMVDYLYLLPKRKRKELLDAHRHTNYSVVDKELIRAIYKMLYDQKVSGHLRSEIVPFVEIESTSETDDGVVAHFRHLHNETRLNFEADAVILATGYKREVCHSILSGISNYLLKDESGYVIDRNYQIKTRLDFHPKVFLQGYSEETHGLSNTLLSLLPYRSFDILQTLLETSNSKNFVRKAVVTR